MEQSVRKEKVKQLKKQCKRLAADGVACRNKIRETSGMDRYHAWDEKRAVGDVARIHYIAYGLLRGRDYGTIEQKTCDGGDAWAVHCRAQAVSRILQSYCIEAEHEHWSVENVERLLNAGRDKVRSSGR